MNRARGRSRSGNGMPLAMRIQGMLPKAWYELGDLTTVFQDSAGTTASGYGLPLGKIADKSGNNYYAAQVTATARPSLGRISDTLGFGSTASYRMVHDFVDDHMHWYGVTGDYWIAVGNISGVQFYQAKLTNTTGTIPLVDCVAMVIRDTAFTEAETATLNAYFSVLRSGLTTKDFIFENDSASFIGHGTTITSGTQELQFGDGTTYTTSFTGTEATVKRESVTYDVSVNSALTVANFHTSELTGFIPSLTAHTGLITAQFYSGRFTGSIPSLTANTALTNLQCQANQLTGSIPSLTANTALSIFSCHSNQLTGSIPSLTANTALTQFYCYLNQLTGSIPSLTANTALSIFYCYSNQLTGSIPSLTANTALTQFYCNNNQITGWTGGTVSITLGEFAAQNNLLTQAAVDAILAAFVAANKTTGTRNLNIGGTGNATPSAAGLADKATLVGRGWTVTTN